MDEAACVHLTQRRSERDCNAQKGRYSQRPAKQSIKDHASRVLEDQRRAFVMAGQRDGARRPGGIEIRPECELVFQSSDAAGRCSIHGNQQNRGSPSPEPRDRVASPFRNGQNE